MKISEILRKAANEHLPAGRSDCGYSCCAVAMAHHQNIGETLRFLKTLGVDTVSGTEFDEFPEGPKRQGARFLWLHFAALVAEDMGK